MPPTALLLDGSGLRLRDVPAAATPGPRHADPRLRPGGWSAHPRTEATKWPAPDSSSSTPASRIPRGARPQPRMSHLSGKIGPISLTSLIGDAARRPAQGAPTMPDRISFSQQAALVDARPDARTRRALHEALTGI